MCSGHRVNHEQIHTRGKPNGSEDMGIFSFLESWFSIIAPEKPKECSMQGLPELAISSAPESMMEKLLLIQWILANAPLWLLLYGMSRTHMGEELYECQECGKGSSWKGTQVGGVHTGWRTLLWVYENVLVMSVRYGVASNGAQVWSHSSLEVVLSGRHLSPSNTCLPAIILIPLSQDYVPSSPPGGVSSPLPSYFTLLASCEIGLWNTLVLNYFPWVLALSSSPLISGPYVSPRVSLLMAWNFCLTLHKFLHVLSSHQ